MPNANTQSRPSRQAVAFGDDVLDLWIETFRGPLTGLVASWCPDWREAAEVAQDVFAEAWVNRARFRGDPKDLAAAGAWLRGIAFRSAAARARTRRRHAHGGTDLDGLRHPSEDEDRESPRMTALRAAFRELSSEQQGILRMHYLEVTTAREVASLLGITQKAVEQRLARARRALRDKAQYELQKRERGEVS